MSEILLQTKLYIPPIRPNIVPRTRLLNKLNADLHGKLTIASAPAGFGKTTLITDWLSQLDHPVGWVSLDEDDSDPQQFFRYVAAATRPFPDIAQTLTSLLQSPQPLLAKALAAALVNDLASVSSPCLLILDDYHEIDSAEIDLALAFLLDHMPPNLHIVITSRADPGFPLSRLRARGQLTELRAQDLRFSTEETAIFLQTIMGISLTPEQIAAIETRTEGWVVGLQMAALSMKNRDDVTGFINNFTGSNRFIMDYLTDEVLQQTVPAIQDFLLQTSILTRLSAPLCTAVIGNGENDDVAQNHLEYLDRTNLFLIPLDDERVWYRYHHLFADLLQKKQGDDVKERHQRASRWYEENGMITDALYHARAAEDFERAAHLIVTHTRKTIAQGNSDTVFAWINAMPDDSIRAHSLLAIGKSWDLLYKQQIPQIESYLLSAEAVLADDDKPSSQDQRGEIYGLRALAARYAGNSQQSVVLCRQALSQLPADNLFARSFVLSALSGALRAEGNTQEAIPVYIDSIETCKKSGYLLGLMGSLHQLYGLYVECGRLHDAEQLLQQSLETYHPYANLPAFGLICLGLGSMAYERNELDQAAAHLEKGISLSQVNRAQMLGQVLLAQIALAKGNNRVAESFLNLVNEILQPWPQNETASYFRARTARIALWKGDLVAARYWQQTFAVQAPESMTYADELQSLVLARLLIAEGRLDSSASFCANALTLLDSIEETAVAAGRFGRAMEAQLLQALAHDALGNTDIATDLLEKALTLAETEGFVRTLVDEREPMAILLRKLEKRPFITQLLAAFPDQVVTISNPSTSSRQSPQSPLIEPLSEREIEILTRIAAGKKNKEIATELFISHNTVLYHTKNLYGKLGVNKRTQAVAKAQELGLI